MKGSRPEGSDVLLHGKLVKPEPPTKSWGRNGQAGPFVVPTATARAGQVKNEERIRELQSALSQALERARAEEIIRSNLEAAVTLQLADAEWLDQYRPFLAEFERIFILSELHLEPGPDDAVTVAKAGFGDPKAPASTARIALSLTNQEPDPDDKNDSALKTPERVAEKRGHPQHPPHFSPRPGAPKLLPGFRPKPLRLPRSPLPSRPLHLHPGTRLPLRLPPQHPLRPSRRKHPPPLLRPRIRNPRRPPKRSPPLPRRPHQLRPPPRPRQRPKLKSRPPLPHQSTNLPLQFRLPSKHPPPPRRNLRQLPLRPNPPPALQLPTRRHSQLPPQLRRQLRLRQRPRQPSSPPTLQHPANRLPPKCRHPPRLTLRLPRRRLPKIKHRARLPRQRKNRILPPPALPLARHQNPRLPALLRKRLRQRRLRLPLLLRRRLPLNRTQRLPPIQKQPSRSMDAPNW